LVATVAGKSKQASKQAGRRRLKDTAFLAEQSFALVAYHCSQRVSRSIAQLCAGRATVTGLTTRQHRPSVLCSTIAKMSIMASPQPSEITAASYVGFDSESHWPHPAGLSNTGHFGSADQLSAEGDILFIAAITQQIEHKLLKRGFQFNIIVVGKCTPPAGPSSSLTD
jgi:hypothetical protein